MQITQMVQCILQIHQLMPNLLYNLEQATRGSGLYMKLN